ncbi:MAG: DsrE family protein [Chloroflexi bacterium]|nr:DsrE family protein [Chloroflexota bacterium]
MTKAAIFVLADTQSEEDLGRVVNALAATQEFKDAGDQVQLIFDGTGTRWPGVLAQPDHIAHGLYQKTRGQVAGVCSFCATAFGVKENVVSNGLNLLDEVNGHPSIKQLVAEGYHIFTF